MTLNEITQLIVRQWPAEYLNDEIVVKHSTGDKNYMKFKQWRDTMKALNQDNREYPRDSVTFCIQHDNQCTTIINFQFIKHETNIRNS